jgi:hypothetical protein
VKILVLRATEPSVTIYQSTRRNIPEDSNIQLQLVDSAPQNIYGMSQSLKFLFDSEDSSLDYQPVWAVLGRDLLWFSSLTTQKLCNSILK